MLCSFCGTETVDIAQGPRVTICYSCIETGETIDKVGQIGRCSFCGNMAGAKLTIKVYAVALRKTLNRPTCSGNVCKPPPFHIKLLKASIVSIPLFLKMKSIRVARNGNNAIICNLCLPVAKRQAKWRRKRRLETSHSTQ